jgi:hypothetical protein
MNHRRWIVVATALLLVIVLVPAASAQKSRAVSSGKMKVVTEASFKLQTMYTAAEIKDGVYVGSSFCLACHTSMSTYKDTNHASFLRRPVEAYSLIPGKGVIADYDGNKIDDFRQGLDFNKITSAFDKYKPNAPILSVENGQYFVTIGTLKMPIAFTLAGQRNGSSQRYTVRVLVTDTSSGLTNSTYFAPLQYAPKTGWSAYSPTAWYDANNAPKYAAGIGSAALVTSGPSNHTSGCIGCHAASPRGLEKTASGEWKYDGWSNILGDPSDPAAIDYDGDGAFEIMNISCENCHGPGAAHIIAAGDPGKIVNPARLKAPQQAEICGRCHITSKSVPAGTFSWPFNDATMTNWTPFDAKNGTALANFYTDTTAKFADGKTQSGGRPYYGYTQSAHATFSLHQVGCPECHDAHEEGEGMLIREKVVQDGNEIHTSVEDNTLCLSCHAKYGPFAELTRTDIKDMNTKAEVFDKVSRVVEKHTHHPVAPERMMGLSRCTGCHMSVYSGSHQFTAVGPEQTLKYQDKGGMANSCAAGCHNNKVDVFGLGVKGTASGWANPIDVKLSNELKTYFGENGIWWKTDKP